MHLKLYSWNVNGLRATSGKAGFRDWFTGSRADYIAFQETKAAPEQLGGELLNPEAYLSYWSAPRTRRGYSGVVTYSRNAPRSEAYELPQPAYSEEGRLVLLEDPAFYFFNVYFPNGQQGAARLKYKLEYYEAFLDYAQTLRKKKPVVVCGDFNTAHRPVDLARPRENEGFSGFLPIEREWLDKFTAAGYVDTYRLLNGPEAVGYTWWSLRTGARARNVGWRLDYFFVSSELKEAVKRAWIEPEVMGSDHCPVGLELSV
ncbi:MAG: exodeoxyribonuclease III [Candidatus Adiutrix sp.]|nr:exodeoxyribonuclease III [Candidatus Adiutrix sp.]